MTRRAMASASDRWRHVAVALCMLAGSALVAQDAVRPTAIRVHRALTVSGAPIEDATIVIEDGKITAIGKSADVTVPEDAEVLEADVATPGFIHPFSTAFVAQQNYDVNGKNSNGDRFVADDLRPNWDGVKALARAGFTRLNVVTSDGGIAPTSVLIKTIAKQDRPIRPEMIIVQRRSALIAGFEPRTSTKAFWKDLLPKAKKAKEGRAAAPKGEAEKPASSATESKPGAESKPGDASRPASRPAAAPPDAKLVPLVDYLDGKLPAILSLQGAGAVMHLQAILKENAEFRPTLFFFGEDAWRVVDRVKELGMPVILPTALRDKPDTIIEVVPPREFLDAGVAVALVPENGFQQEYTGFAFHVGELVRRGVDPAQALRAVTLTPAEILGIQSEVGSLEKGKAGDVLLWTGAPFEPTSRLLRVVVGGETVLDVSKEQ